MAGLVGRWRGYVDSSHHYRQCRLLALRVLPLAATKCYLALARNHKARSVAAKVSICLVAIGATAQLLLEYRLVAAREMH